MTPGELRALALTFPGAAEGFNMGSAVFKVDGRVLARLLGDGEAMLTGVGPDEIDHLIEIAPQAFHATQHYRDAACVAVRLAQADPVMIRALLERRFRVLAKRATLKAWEAGRADATSGSD